MNLIDKDELIQAMAKRKQYVGRLSDPDCLVQDAPTIDAVPLKHGRWFEKAVGNILQSAKCSVCRKNHTTLYEDYFTHYDYCPNCGAIMDEKKVEE